jgi:glycerophosphoryl diester phosphodiesterase
MLLLGHRGCRGEITENTLAAFDRAIECGCDGFELDVRLSSDGVPVIWHDARVRGRAIARHTFQELCERCGSSHQPTQAESGLEWGTRHSPSPHIRQMQANMGHPPTRARRREAIELCQLEDVLTRYAAVGWIDVELKVRGTEAQVVELLRRYPRQNGFVVSSFRRAVLLELHRIDPGLPLGFIFDRMPREKTWRELPIQFVKPSARLVTQARVRQFHEAGMKVLTWTVNRAAALRRLSEAGVDGVIGDDPAMLAEGRFQSFKDARFQGFKVSKFQS